MAPAASVSPSGEVPQRCLGSERRTQSGARMDGGALEIDACNWPATATAVKCSRRASLEWRSRKAELKANAIRRTKVTASRPRLGTGSRCPEALVCWGRCWQACRKPCLKAQCLVRSIQPLFSCFQRLCPSWRMGAAGKDWTVRIQSIQQRDVEEAASVRGGQTAQQPQRRRILTLARPQPLDGQERFDRALNHLAADGTMIVLRLFNFAAGLILLDHAALQATVTAAAETRQHLDAVQGGQQSALHLSFLEAFTTFQTAVDVH